jgi:abhydrolase domain-containing protein 14
MENMASTLDAMPGPPGPPTPEPTASGKGKRVLVIGILVAVLGLGAVVASGANKGVVVVDSADFEQANPETDSLVADVQKKRSLVNIVETEKATLKALKENNFSALSDEMKQTLKKAAATTMRGKWAKNNGRGKNLTKLHKALAMFNKTDEKVKVKVTKKGEKIKTKFASKKTLGITVPGSKVPGPMVAAASGGGDGATVGKVRNYTFEEMFIEHPDLFTQDLLKEMTISKRVKSVYITHAIPPKPLISLKTGKPVAPVLLLHGAKFSSSTWDKTGTVQALVTAGFSVYTVDLPGYGRSEGKVDAPLREVFLRGLIIKLKLQKPFIISPSMSGTFSVPYVRDYPDELSGYMPIAATKLKTIQAETWNTVANKTWIMYVYGEKDVEIGAPGAKFFEKAPNVDIFMMKQGTHPCYLDKPKQFNQKMLKWLNRATRTKLTNKNAEKGGMGGKKPGQKDGKPNLNGKGGKGGKNSGQKDSDKVGVSMGAGGK